MSRRIKAMGPPTEKSKRYLVEYAEHGFGYPVTSFNKKFGYGNSQHRRWSSDIMGFRDKFESLKYAHENREKATGPMPCVLPASHTESLTIWQQNFLESWRRTKKKLDACVKAKVSWSEVKKSLDMDEAFRVAYVNTEEELMVGLRDELMAGGYGGNIGAIAKLLSTREATENKEEDDKDWWKDAGDVAEAFR